MGQLLSGHARDNMLKFLFSHCPLLPEGETLTGVHFASREELGLREGEDDRMNDILSVDYDYDSGEWRIEVRRPRGGRMMVSDPGSFQTAMSKARQAELEPA